ncbi:hypothetical protein CRUP_003539 [Coryphaenoides rupestris]|nr:hypothetical protein CRUP_003539 [Coryphaenoides rupestris]
MPSCSPDCCLLPAVEIVKIFGEDGMGKVVEIPADMTARDLCQLLVYKTHCVDDNSWALVEHHPLLGLERCLEDHELVVHVQASMSSDSRFLFRKNYAKYEFFRNPLNFLATSSYPEIQGYLYVKEVGRKSWKKLYMFLRRSGLYCSTKGTSKANKGRVELKDLRILCAEDERSRTCWMTAFRLFKYGIILYQNYKIPQQRKTLLSHFSAPVRSVSENSLVAMDFSGRIGRDNQGGVTPLFLLRVSQSNPKAFVLTLCHHQKIKHFQILPCEEDGQIFFSLDDGATKFTDLIQLVEFYQLNRGVLPCKLRHPCTNVAL